MVRSHRRPQRQRCGGVRLSDTISTLQLSDPRFEHRHVRHATVRSEALDRRADCTLWIPAGCPESAHLVILLHGVYASHWAWIGCGGAHLVAESLAADPSLPPFVLAMPSDGLYGHGSGYATTQGGDVERWIIDEVPAIAAVVTPAIDPHAPISIVGLSMGGFGALTLGAWNADRVAAVAGMSSITDFDQMALFVGALDAYRIADDRRSVLGSMLANRTSLPRIRVDCGSDDLLIAHNRGLHDALTAADIEHSWSEYPGEHEWAYWHRHLPEAIRFCLT